MDMLKQLNAAMVYIEQNLCNDVHFDEAARIACVTRDSLMRFFSYMTGMTLPRICPAKEADTCGLRPEAKYGKGHGPVHKIWI